MVVLPEKKKEERTNDKTGYRVDGTEVPSLREKIPSDNTKHDSAGGPHQQTLLLPGDGRTQAGDGSAAAGTAHPDQQAEESGEKDQMHHHPPLPFHLIHGWGRDMRAHRRGE